VPVEAELALPGPAKTCRERTLALELYSQWKEIDEHRHGDTARPFRSSKTSQAEDMNAPTRRSGIISSLLYARNFYIALVDAGGRVSARISPTSGAAPAPRNWAAVDRVRLHWAACCLTSRSAMAADGPIN
jgi:hypothetical protein